jgi:hypothetical protein
MLPDSGHNQLGSNGGVTFTIKTRPNLPLGTIIDNTAYIYFDFNPAVVTNTTSNMIWINVPLSVSEAASGSISSYPNPTNGKTTIRLSDEFAGKQNELVVTDAMGRSIMTKTFSGTSIDLDLADYSSGIYFCAIHSNGSMVGVKRLVKE